MDLSAHAGRGACTDAERRAALWLHDELRTRGHEAWVETQWVRPQWAVSLALGSLLAVAGSLVSTAAALPGLIAAAAGALTMLVRPFPRRATQHVLTGLPRDGVVLAITAAYDVPRRGMVDPRRIRPAWPAACALVIVAATAARVAGFDPGWLGVVQLVPTVALLVVMALAADLALSGWDDDHAAAPTTAIALFDELTRDPPHNLRPMLLLAGAGHALPGGAARQLRAEGLRPDGVVMLQLVDGPLFWAARHPQVRAAAERAAATLGVEAEPRRMPPTRLPAIRIGAGDGALDLALGIVDALDPGVRGSRAPSDPRPAR